jgi:uncharacterized phiE125 gp8 family phage protein
MSVVVVTPPNPEIDLELVKQHLRVEHGDDDELIQAYLDAAVAHIDGPFGKLNRAIWEQTLELRQNTFSAPIRLPYGPVSAVASIKYVDADGVEQTVSADDYLLTSDGYVVLAHGSSWPRLRGDAEGVRVRYTAGFETVPSSILSAVMLTVGHWYANRETVVVGEGAAEVPMAVEALLAPYRLWSI